MKNILYMTGAVINAGDFLIEKRMLALLERFMPDAKITKVCRVGVDYNNQLDFLNSFDAIIFAGGPIYQRSIYPNAIPFVSREKLERLTTPLFFFGGGNKSDVYASKMSADTHAFFQKGTELGCPLGCRDILTYRFLKHQGFSNVLMTGCPAWYDLGHVNQLEVNKHRNEKLKICVSEPARNSNLPLLGLLLHKLREAYSNAEITLVVHREAKPDLVENGEWSKRNMDGIRMMTIAGSDEGFHIYDDCDMHIGFRVHAHIYNLSIRNISFLINEDIRGNGVNQTLGLENINIEDAYSTSKRLLGNYFFGKKSSKNSENTIYHLLDCIEMAERNNYQNFMDAYAKMRNTFEVMQSHIKQVGNSIVENKR